MKKYTELNAQMERIACIIRQFYLFRDKHNSHDEIAFICDFVEHMRTLEKIEDIDTKYKSLFDEYIKRVGTDDELKELAPDIFK